MKTLIIFTFLFSTQIKADDYNAALNSLAKSGWANDHFPAYQFHYSNRPTPDENTVRAFESLSHDNAVMNQQNTQQNCYFDYYKNTRICN